jgi:predicted ester cyclase
MQKRRIGVVGLFLAAAALVSAVALAATGAKKTNRQVVERWFEIVDGKQFDKFGEIETADLEMTVPMGPVKGTEGHVQLSRGFAAAFPNYKHTLTSCVESGEAIACEGTFAGDHTGPMAMPNGQSLPATGKHVEFGWAGMARVKNGKVASVHVYFDNLSFMTQLGVIPPPGGPKGAAR